jgi:hypothetical protein
MVVHSMPFLRTYGNIKRCIASYIVGPEGQVQLVPVNNISEYFKKMMNNPRMRVKKEGDEESPSHGNFTSLTAASFTASVSTLSANFCTSLATSVLTFLTCFRTSITNVGTKTCDQLRIYTVTSDQLTD